ncbi:hexitol phosphatase HxpB [Vibrio coralliilyticus]|uniref:hexitol phosphatase HxpB n=1 Tax=Vibrio coralliilyticus TaxID=190893 RepID=UPI00148E70F2|nr:hexitol phosphatase HxpB [Vibrio coralliilyticus]NOI27142.1 hexitol phosphatase HxpB [Vibrio coralliilyticus]NOI46567.1 hexitol phosphatase HxpB [Vibrio coralliilyticus]
MNKKAVIFDMDGVIIDSEPFWQHAQQTSLANYGVSVTIEECMKYTMGKRADEIADIWCERYSLEVPPKFLEKSTISCLRKLIAAHGQPMKGLHNALDFFKRNNMTIALATSSNHSIINSVFNKLGLWNHFSIIRSAEDEEFGKPHPGVYLTTAKELGLPTNECLVIEDSFNGMKAAKAADMETHLVSSQCHEEKFIVANGKYRDLDELVEKLTA